MSKYSNKYFIIILGIVIIGGLFHITNSNHNKDVNLIDNSVAFADADIITLQTPSAEAPSAEAPSAEAVSVEVLKAEIKTETDIKNDSVTLVNSEATYYSAEDKYDVINGVSLMADKKAVLNQLGEPLKINTEEFFPEMEEYHYAHMKIQFINDDIQSIAVPVTEKEIQWGSQVLSTDPTQLEKALGEPKLIAEDGVLYYKNNIYIKLYYKQGTTEPESIHFFIQGI